VDANFNPNVNNEVRASAILSDGKVLIGGAFTTVGGTSQNYLARLNSDGSLDQDWNVTINGNGYVEDIYVQSNGAILIGGSFTNVSGLTRHYVARLVISGDDYAVDGAFSDSGLNNAVVAIGAQSFGSEIRPIVGGLFSNSGHRLLARLSSSGVIDSTFSADVAGGSVNALAVASDNTTYLGGNFTTVTGTSRNNAGWVDTNGYQITGPEFTANPDGYVDSIAIFQSGEILLGGEFTTVHGSAITNVAKVDNYGVVLDDLQKAGPNGTIQAIKVISNKYVIGGGFNSIGNTARTNLARLNSDRTVDTAFTGVTMVGGEVQTMSLFSNGDILIGGTFTNVNGLTRNRIARIVP